MPNKLWNTKSEEIDTIIKENDRKTNRVSKGTSRNIPKIPLK